MSRKKNKGQFFNIFCNVILPSLILIKFSDEKHLGQFYGLIIALLFPLGYGIFELIKNKEWNFFSGLGLVSVLLTGGIGLLKLDRNWMVVKEVGFPLVIGIIGLTAEFYYSSLFKKILVQILNMPLIEKTFIELKEEEIFKEKIKVFAYFFWSTFFISALLNYIVAESILRGQPGSEEFTKSLGLMTAISFPVITLPMTLMMGFILYYFFNFIKKRTALKLEKILNI